MPYVRPIPIAKSWAPFEPSELLEPVDELPKPVYTAEPEVSAAELPLAVAAIVLMVEVLTLLGSWAPHGCEVRHADTQAELADPQLSAHWVLDSVHSKYGMVWEYSEAFGDWPLLQTHSKSKVSWESSVYPRPFLKCRYLRPHSCLPLFRQHWLSEGTAVGMLPSVWCTNPLGSSQYIDRIHTHVRQAYLLCQYRQYLD